MAVKLSLSSTGKCLGTFISPVLIIHSRNTAQLFVCLVSTNAFWPATHHFGYCNPFVFLWRNYILCSSLHATLHAYTHWWRPHTQSLLVTFNPCWEHGSTRIHCIIQLVYESTDDNQWSNYRYKPLTTTGKKHMTPVTNFQNYLLPTNSFKFQNENTYCHFLIRSSSLYLTASFFKNSSASSLVLKRTNTDPLNTIFFVVFSLNDLIYK